MYHGKAIYEPQGKAGEYAKYAANFYNGCSAKCEYCYNRKGITAKILGGEVPMLKKCLKDEETAREIFIKEIYQNTDDLQKNGLFFNFVSDPCLPETLELNLFCARMANQIAIPIKLLTKQTWWIDWFLGDYQNAWNKKFITIGFTLTGHDELEPGTATNHERIESMKRLYDAGFKTWASIEPIIDCDSSFDMINRTSDFCNHYKIGLKSPATQYDYYEINNFIRDVLIIIKSKRIPVYFKDSLLKVARIKREKLPFICVTRDFNL